MIRNLFSLKLLACAPLVLAASLFAQDAASSPVAAPAPAQGEMRERIQAAKKKALEDPKIELLREQYFAALKAAMIKADPGLKDFLQNFGKPGKGSANPGKPAGKKAGQKLGDADKQKLKAAREAAQNDPAVIAAQTKKNVATNPEEKAAARKEYHAALRAAMIKNDPSIEALLEKKHASGKQSGQ